ncbi:MAG: hypothetical protein ACLTBF_06365, partial [Christensenellales bacterium]
SAAPFPSKQAFFSSQPPLPAVCLRGISFSAIKTNQRRTFFLFFEKKRDSFLKFHFTSILPRFTCEKKGERARKMHKKQRAPHILFDKSKFPPCLRVYAFSFLYYTIL